MRRKKWLSSILAAAMLLNSGAVNVMAAGNGREGSMDNQVVSAEETVYVNSYGAGERTVSFNDHWRFHLGDASGAQAEAYNDSEWESVTVPHDYSIDQGFSTAAPAEQESGYVLGGTGWYRKSFTLSEDMRGKTVSIEFDGIYMNATVYLNGVQLGTHPYGYTPFSFVFPQESLKFGGGENVLAVKVEHNQPSSRWYSGSGIYRDVNLTVTDPVHVAYYGTQVTTPDIENGTGTVQVAAAVQNDGSEAAEVSVRQSVYELGGKEPLATGEKTAAQTVAAGEEARITSSVTVPEPKLWDTEHPNLYTVRTEVYVGDTLTDSYDTEFGFRWVTFTKDNGFFLNGKNVKLKGVSMHHDQGGLGSEAWYRSIERQVEILKEMGVNAIRVTHNPASQVLIDVCNRKGVMLVEEAFDCWLSGKAGNTEDYGKWFAQPIEAGNQIVGAEGCEQWAEFDLKAMVKRGRNAPSIVMWSLGNEVFQQLIDSSKNNQFPDTAKKLITWVGEEDATRFVTFGDNQVKGNVWANNAQVNTALVFADAESYGVPGGLVGFNYGGSSQIQAGYNRGWMVYGSETASAVNSRGVYDRKVSCSDGNVGDRRLTSYDKSCVSWGHTASDGLWITMRQAFNAGEFVWTGFDYIGEPTPYNWQGTGANGTWPNIAKNSYFGIIDTAGFPKDTYYLYQSQWNDQVRTLHVLPVWNEDEIMIDGNGKAEVVVYSDAPVVKLYLNGEEVGTASAVKTDTPTGGYWNYTSGTGCFDTSKAGSGSSSSLYATFQVPYEEGRLEAKAFEADGTTPITDTKGRSFVETTSAANRLQAKADREIITADGKDLSYVEIDVTDASGRFVNGAEPEITVSVSGAGKLLAVDNGVQNDVTSYSEPTRKAGKGKLLAIVQSTEEEGSFTVKAEAPGYVAAETTVATKAAADGAEQTKEVVSYKISRNYYVKAGQKPELPGQVKVQYSDDTEETKAVTWDAIPEGESVYTVSGVIADINLGISVNVNEIGNVASVLNYSAAVGQNTDPALPAARPAVQMDGSILSAEFPVTWDVPENLTGELGVKEVKGTAAVFDETFPVTASIRVTNGTYRDGDEALGNVPEMYINGVSSASDDRVADVLKKLRDDKTGKEDAAWTGRGTLDFRLDTAIELKNFTLYIKDTAPLSDTVKVYASGDNGASWTLADCKVTNQKAAGVTVRTYTPAGTVSETWFRVEFTKKTTLTELEMNTRIPSFPIGSEAALESLEIGGYIAGAAALESGSYAVADENLDVQDLAVEGKDNASITVLPKNAENEILLLLESEDHKTRDTFKILVGVEDTRDEDASDDSKDYPAADMTLTAPSVEKGGSVDSAKDGNSSTIWHSNWGGGIGQTDLSGHPEDRYIEMQLASEEMIDGVRYLRRPAGGSGSDNGVVVDYRIEVSTDGTTFTKVAEGAWDTKAEWSLAKFDAVSAKYIRLYGVSTIGDAANKYMSAAEVRVRYAASELHQGNTTVAFQEDEVSYTGSEVTPKPVVSYQASGAKEPVVLEEGADYVLSYKNNIEPGTAAVYVTGRGKYYGILKAEFTIVETALEILSYEEISVTTGKGVYPALPGTVVAETNIGRQTLEVQWDQIGSSALKEFGTVLAMGTVTNGDRITASVTVSDIIGAETVSMAAVAGEEPAMPTQVQVYYDNGRTEERKVTWDLSGADFTKAGIVEVTGTAGGVSVKASIRMVEGAADANSTPVGKNLALNPNGVSNPKSWPRTFAYVSPTGDPVHNATNGVKSFVSNSSKKIWSDWENGKYHTNASAAVGAADHVPFVATAFGVDGSTNNEDQKKYTVNKVSIGFMEEDGTSAHKVRLPQDYKIEYYSADSGVIPADRLVNDTANGYSNTRGWAADNPIKAHDGWTEVTYIGGKPAVPALDGFKQMVDVSFEAVETTAIRITLTPQAENWTGLEEFEVYYIPVSENETFEMTGIQVDGREVLGEFDEATKTLQIEAADGEITAQATDHASVTVLEQVNGEAKIIVLPENGDETKKEEYKVIFTKAQSSGGNLVLAQDAMVEAENARAESGAIVTFGTKEGYEFAEDTAIAILKSADLSDTGITVTRRADGTCFFVMPEYGVTIQGATRPVEYQISYDLNGGEAAGNPDTYTIESFSFTLNNPTKENAVFLGWTSDTVTEPTKAMKVEEGTTGNLAFTANWREGSTYTVTFESNGGTAVAEMQVSTAAGKAEEPQAPTRLGYAFAGWYRDAALKTPWDFANDTVTEDMTLYAKWTEAEITLNTTFAAYTIGADYRIPAKVNVTVSGKTFDTFVTWNEAELAAVLAAKEAGTYNVTGILEKPEGRTVTARIKAAPENIVYFVDSGATEFTEKGQILADANKDTMKNSAPDQAYTEEAGWGFTNAEDTLEVNGSGDAYTTIRNFRSGQNGQTLTYRFALEAGTYQIAVGFYDPWAQWAGDDRHTKVTVTDGTGAELAVEADHHISGAKDMVQFDAVEVAAAGNLDINIAPTKSNGDNSDMMVSFLVITKKAFTVEELEQKLAKQKAELSQKEAALQQAETALAEKESELTAKDKELLKKQEELDAKDKELDEKQGELTATEEKLKAEQARAAALQEQLDQAQDSLEKLQQSGQAKDEQINSLKAQVQELTSQKNEAQGNVDKLTSQLEAVKQDVERLQAEKDRLAGEKADLQTQITALQTALEDAKAEVLKAQQELTEAKEKEEQLKAELANARKEAEQNKAELDKIKKELEDAKAEADQAKKDLEAAKAEAGTTLKKGATLSDGVIRYRVTDDKKHELEVYGAAGKRLKSIRILSSIQVNGVSYRVTSIADKAFAKQKALKKVVIGKYVTSIGKSAFAGDKKLAKLIINSKKLKSVGKNALKGISKKAVIQVPKAKRKAYRKLFKGKGQKKTVKMK